MPVSKEELCYTLCALFYGILIKPMIQGLLLSSPYQWGSCRPEKLSKWPVAKAGPKAGRASLQAHVLITTGDLLQDGFQGTLPLPTSELHFANLVSANAANGKLARSGILLSARWPLDTPQEEIQRTLKNKELLSWLPYREPGARGTCLFMSRLGGGEVGIWKYGIEWVSQHRQNCETEVWSHTSWHRHMEIIKADSYVKTGGSNFWNSYLARKAFRKKKKTIHFATQISMITPKHTERVIHLLSSSKASMLIYSRNTHWGTAMCRDWGARWNKALHDGAVRWQDAPINRCFQHRVSWALIEVYTWLCGL